MNPRQRLLTALNHKEPDRVPFDMGSTVVTGIHRIAYKNLLEYLGIEQRKIEIIDTIQQLAMVDDDVIERLKIDIKGIFTNPPSNWELEITDAGDYKQFTDEWGITWKMPKIGGYYFDMAKHPLKGANIEMVEKNKWPDADNADRYKGLKERAKKLYENTEYALITGNPLGGGLVEQTIWLQGFEDGFANLAGDTEITDKFLEKILELKMRYYDNLLDEIGQYISVVIDGDDLGTQYSSLFSLAFYRKHVKPRQKELYSFIKKKAKVYIFFHTCGSCYDFIPDLIEIGVDILNPVQIRAANMDPKKLKKEFGKYITFWGGIDTQRVLPEEKPEEVKDEVKKIIDILAPGGGFVFNTVHNIQADIPPENIMAMWEGLQQYGNY